MLARAFLRLTALEALRPSALLAVANPAWPTLAGTYVYDSRIAPLDDLSGDDRRPIIGVYTEGTRLTKIAQAGPTFYKGEVDLVFEISVVQNFNVDGEVVVDYADTDAAAESQLDALAEQIKHALHFGPTGALFRRIAKIPLDDWDDSPKHPRSGEESIKLAARTIRTRVRVQDSCFDPAPVTVPADFDRLPPALQAIATQLGESTYLHDLALGMARMAPVMPVRVNLNTVGITAAPQPGVSGTIPVQGAADNLQGS